MSVDMVTLVADLRAEGEALLELLDGNGTLIDLQTPAAPWTIRDQITHLAFFDGVARMSLTEPERFVGLRDVANRDLQAYVDRSLDEGADLTAGELSAWFERERADLARTLTTADASQRVPWFGPDMTAASHATARIMETWAHGEDVADALGVSRQPTARLRHVAHLGVRARPYAHQLHSLEPPAAPIHVALTAPDGSTWTWDPPDAPDGVVGPALDFCRVVTRRTHVDDTQLEVTGTAAAQWMRVAQAYAGPSGSGRVASSARKGRA